MKFSEYQELSRRTMAQYDDPDKRKMIAALGATGEAGEIADLVKKSIGHGHPENTEKIAEEIGDYIFYGAFLCECYGLDFEKIATENVEKLKRRYPDGFSPEASLNRGEK